MPRNESLVIIICCLKNEYIFLNCEQNNMNVLYNFFKYAYIARLTLIFIFNINKEHVRKISVISWLRIRIRTQEDSRQENKKWVNVIFFFILKKSILFNFSVLSVFYFYTPILYSSIKYLICISIYTSIIQCKCNGKNDIKFH